MLWKRAFGAGMMLAIVFLLSPALTQTSFGDEPQPVNNPEDIRDGAYPPQSYVVLPVPRGDLQTMTKAPLLHQDVLDERGQKLGRLEKLIMDTKSGKIVYAVISLHDGRLTAVPWSKLTTTREKNAVVISSTQQQLETALGETAREIRALMRPGMASGTHTIKGRVQKIVGGDYVITDAGGARTRFHVENGTRMDRVPVIGDSVEVQVNDSNTAMAVHIR